MDGENALRNPAALTAAAFKSYFGSGGGYFVSISLVFFVVSTITVVIFYGVKQAEFLFGRIAWSCDQGDLFSRNYHRCSGRGEGHLGIS
ncbi:alanine:cation symporter family protein [Bacillus sonorensis]|nr:alanine:cation symporter family protein [Bacillus sonorensis]